MTARIEIIFGPMFSGKSTELIRRIRRHTVAKARCLMIKYHKDLRYSSEDLVCTHDKQTWDSFPCAQLVAAWDEALKHDVIGIDEGQFFPEIAAFCEALATRGKIVIVAALDSTFQRKPFGRILELVPLAENVTKLNSVCSQCHGDAAFSHRLAGDEEAVEMIGGLESYEALCRKCFLGK